MSGMKPVATSPNSPSESVGSQFQPLQPGVMADAWQGAAAPPSAEVPGVGTEMTARQRANTFHYLASLPGVSVGPALREVIAEAERQAQEAGE